MAKKISFDAARNDDGTINIENSLLEAETALESAKTMEERDQDTILTAVQSVFETKVAKGGSLNMAALTSFTLQLLDVPASQYSETSERVAAVMKAHTDINEKRDKSGNVIVEAEPFGTRLFHSKRGPGGGVVMCSHAAVKS